MPFTRQVITFTTVSPRHRVSDVEERNHMTHHHEDTAIFLLDRLLLSALQAGDNTNTDRSRALHQNLDRFAEDTGDNVQLWRAVVEVAVINLAVHYEDSMGVDNAIAIVSDNIARYLDRD
jgi:hypothetical protein